MSTNDVRVQGSPLLVFNTPDGVNHAIYQCLVCSNSKVSPNGSLLGPCIPRPRTMCGRDTVDVVLVYWCLVCNNDKDKVCIV